MVTAVSTINQKMSINAHKKRVINAPFKKVFAKLKQNPWKVPVRDKELFSKFEGYRCAFLPNSSTKYELLHFTSIH